jgi:hypothetical protein
MTHSARFVVADEPHSRVSSRSAGCDTTAAAAPASMPASTMAKGCSRLPSESGMSVRSSVLATPLAARANMSYVTSLVAVYGSCRIAIGVSPT